MGTLTVKYNNTNIINGVSQSSPPNITYNGSTLVSGLVGTKTLNCANEKMSANVIVGTKTLLCSGKKMATTVVCTYTKTYTIQEATNPSPVSSMWFEREQPNVGNSVGSIAFQQQLFVNDSFTVTKKRDVAGHHVSPQTGNNSYWIRGGGRNQDSASQTYTDTTAFNSSYTKLAGPSLSHHHVYAEAFPSCGSLAFIAGGWKTGQGGAGTAGCTDVVDYINTSLTRGTASAMSQPCVVNSVGTVGWKSRIIFHNGHYYNGAGYSENVYMCDTYNTSGTKSSWGYQQASLANQGIDVNGYCFFDKENTSEGYYVNTSGTWGHTANKPNPGSYRYPAHISLNKEVGLIIPCQSSSGNTAIYAVSSSITFSTIPTSYSDFGALSRALCGRMNDYKATIITNSGEGNKMLKITYA